MAKKDEKKYQGKGPVGQGTTPSGISVRGSQEAVNKLMAMPAYTPSAAERESMRARTQIRSAAGSRPVNGGGAAAGNAGPEWLTKDNAPNMGWKSRMAINKELGDNYRTGLQGQNNLDAQELRNQGGRAEQLLRNTGQMNVQQLQEQGAGQRLMAGHQNDMDKLTLGNKFDTQKLNLQNRFSVADSNRKVAGEALLQGAPWSQQMQDLYNNQDTGRGYDLSGINVPQKQVGQTKRLGLQLLRGDKMQGTNDVLFDPNTGMTYDPNELNTRLQQYMQDEEDEPKGGNGRPDL